MADVKIDMPERTERGQRTTRFGPRLLVDGAEIKEVRDFSVSFPIDGVATLRLEAFVEHEFSINLEARIEPHLHVRPGWHLVEDRLVDGRRLFRAAREPAGRTSWDGDPQAADGSGRGREGLPASADSRAVVREALELARRPHLHCDDSWYCCPACACPDHEGAFMNHGGEYLRGREPGDRSCACGADAVNVKVDAALALLP